MITEKEYLSTFKEERLNHPKLLFVHIPKTGGTYVAQWEGINPDKPRVGDNLNTPVLSNMFYLGHGYICKSGVVNRGFATNPITGYVRSFFQVHGVVPPEFARHFVKFTIIRNHFDWFTSYYYQQIHAKIKDGDHYIATKGFEHMVKHIANRETPWPNRRFIFLQAFNGDGLFTHNYICRTETLESDLEYLAKICNETYTPKKKQRVSKNKKDYRTYYSDELVELIQSTWGDEIALYGYTFDSKEADIDNKFQRIIYPETIKTLRYCYDRDVL